MCKSNKPLEYQTRNCSGLKFFLTDKEIQDVVKLHNDKRALHRTPPLTLSNRLNKYSQQLADHLAKERIYWHTPEDTYGVSVYHTNWHADFEPMTATDAVENWYLEGLLFNRHNYFEYLALTMHYTQLLWKDSVMIGVGASKSSEDNWYVVCTYVPPGNVISKIRQNVLPLAHIQIREKERIYNRKIIRSTMTGLLLVMWLLFVFMRYTILG